MFLTITNLARLRDGLARLDAASVAHLTLETEADRLADLVRDLLSHPPGSPDHTTPWKQTGTLQASIGVTADETSIVIGSSDAVAVYQEQGTRNDPPRPFLARVANEQASEVATTVATATVTAMKVATE